ncbi:MAG TPA: dTDP-4-dehydrorhamnose reductase [Thermoanaerobaculia bacterium]|nr:dTDP-4-dehydrorhamnose reductase [Thermoanaerobaculia bacterium]
MRALVLGGTGMLGRAVVAAGRRRGASVLGLSHAQGDVTDRERLLYWADTFRPTVVFHCAAFTRVDDCETRRDHAFAVNAEGAAHAAAAAERVGARLVFVSTDYVFDGRGDAPYDEDDATHPLSVYGASKLEGERRALAGSEEALVVRTSWLFGPGGPNFVATIARRVEEGGGLRVVDDQTGCPTYTPFLARALWDLATAGARGVVHYRNREPVTWYGFAREIAHLIDRTTPVEPVTTAEFPRPAPRPAYSVLGVERFERITGRGVEPWAVGLVDYLARRRERRA